jgi:regulator of nonsense transcripts 2
LLPTEVEFALLDTFDVIDSKWRLAVKDTIKASKSEQDKSVLGFPRYATWLEAHNATVAVEEADAVREDKTRARLELLAGAADGIDSSIEGDASNDLELMIDEDESIDDQMSLSVNDETDSAIDSQEAEDDASDSENESKHEAISDEESLEESKSRDTRDTDDYVSEEEEIDEEAYIRQLEEEAFERELRRLTMDALEKGKNTARTSAGGKVADNMPSGSQFIRKKPPEASKLDDDEPVLALGGQEGVSFQLLKKGNKGKMQVKQFVVPLNTNLAKRATKQDDDAAKERDLLKARVLQYEADSAEQGSGGNVYLEQDKLQFIRNRPLTMDDIDRNFGSTGGDSSASKAAATARPTPGSRRSAPPNMKPRSQPPGRGGRGGRGRSGRSLYF